MTGYLHGFRETAGGIRYPVRIAVDNIGSAPSDWYFYAYSLSSSDCRFEMRFAASDFPGPAGEFYIEVWDEHGRHARRRDTADIGEAPYHADAVHFDGDNLFQRLTPFDGLSAGVSKFTWSVWLANTVKKDGQGALNNVLMASNLNSAYLLLGSRQTGTTGFLVSVQDTENFLEAPTDDDIYPIVDWTHIVVSADLDHELDADKVVQIFVAGVQKAVTKDGSDGAIAIPLNLAGAYPFCVGASNFAGHQSIYDCADLQFWAGQAVDLTNPANLAKFIDEDGKPVDPAVAAAAFGPQTLLFSGDSESFNNQGSAGAFGLVQPWKFATGNNGPGSIVLAGAVIGTSVVAIINDTSSANVTADFESTISVTDQIQQTGAQDYSADTLIISLGGSVTNASTSPSD